MENLFEERIICIFFVDLDIINNYLVVILYFFLKKLNSILVIGLIRIKKCEVSKCVWIRFFCDIVFY